MDFTIYNIGSFKFSNMLKSLKHASYLLPCCLQDFYKNCIMLTNNKVHILNLILLHSPFKLIYVYFLSLAFSVLINLYCYFYVPVFYFVQWYLWLIFSFIFFDNVKITMYFKMSSLIINKYWNPLACLPFSPYILGDANDKQIFLFH